MFIGHFALGLAAKRATPRISLGMLFLAAQFADTLWPFLLLAGLEQVRIQPANSPFLRLEFLNYPYSHSLLLLVAWGVVVGAGYRAIAGGRGTFAMLGLLVVSHWVLDYVTHRPDLPLYPGGPKVGLGLWSSTGATMIVEVVLFAGGVALYVRSTRARDRIGRWGFFALVGTLLLLYVSSIVGPAPPSVTAISIVGIVGAVLLVAWAWWVDYHRDYASQV